MTRSPFDPAFDTLPATLPIFPLPGALLLPGGKLPLQIFEPRYLAMTRDALASDRLIGMIQPIGQTSEAEGPVAPTAALYPIGCAGRITSFSETDDGRHLITLSGLCRFAIVREVPTVGGYRRAMPDFARFRADMEPVTNAVIERDRLLKALKAFFAAQKVKVDWKAVGDIADDTLVTTFAMLCPFAPQEKQALLEAPDVSERSRVLTALLELAMLAGDGECLRH
jgi:Lon protease-like protein